MNIAAIFNLIFGGCHIMNAVSSSPSSHRRTDLTVFRLVSSRLASRYLISSLSNAKEGGQVQRHGSSVHMDSWTPESDVTIAFPIPAHHSCSSRWFPFIPPILKLILLDTLDAHQLGLKHQYAVGRNRSDGLFAIAQLGRDRQPALLADTHVE